MHQQQAARESMTEAFEQGQAAYRAGLPRSACGRYVHHSKSEEWWLKGFDLAANQAMK